jgi:hypothetical protein
VNADANRDIGLFERQLIGRMVIQQDEANVKGVMYCIISTKCSRGVMCDAREHYLAKFMGKILAVTGTKSIHFSPK